MVTDTTNTSPTPTPVSERLQEQEHPAYQPVALVAGGSRGLGLLIARELAARGCRPVICARDATELDEAARLLGAWGHRAERYVCDVTDHEAVEALVRQVEQEVGPVEVAVHVAGVIQVGPLASLTREHFRQAIDIMEWGPINLALAVLPGMKRRRRGHIGTVTSIGGMVSVPHLLPYSTAKFAAVGFSQGLRAELAGTGISVTTIVPGLMRTGSHLRAEFTGNQSAEYAWFAPGASLPLISMDAERAAAKIAQRVMEGKGLVVLTPLAKVGVRVSGVAPGTTAAIMGAVGRLLPKAPAGDPGTVDGHHARARLGSSIVEGLTVLGTRAARRFNEMSPS
jgi:NAD(P)-dependent dehydrogenase (short-subunit alcohol dehydrogenase family)